jgi:hypothetical protein
MVRGRARVLFIFSNKDNYYSVDEAISERKTGKKKKKKKKRRRRRRRMRMSPPKPLDVVRGTGVACLYFFTIHSHTVTFIS